MGVWKAANLLLWCYLLPLTWKSKLLDWVHHLEAHVYRIKILLSHASYQISHTNLPIFPSPATMLRWSWKMETRKLPHSNAFHNLIHLLPIFDMMVYDDLIKLMGLVCYCYYCWSAVATGKGWKANVWCLIINYEHTHMAMVIFELIVWPKSISETTAKSSYELERVRTLSLTNRFGCCLPTRWEMISDVENRDCKLIGHCVNGLDYVMVETNLGVRDDGGVRKNN